MQEAMAAPRGAKGTLGWIPRAVLSPGRSSVLLVNSFPTCLYAVRPGFAFRHLQECLFFHLDIKYYFILKGKIATKQYLKPRASA